MTTALSQEIRLARKRLRMNQAQFAEALEASQGSVSKWESGREVPRIETLLKIGQLVPEFTYVEQDNRAYLNPPPLRDGAMRMIKAPLVGAFFDGSVIYPQNQGFEIAFPLDGDWTGTRFEAYGMETLQREFPDSTGDRIGIFALFGDNDRIDDIGRRETVLFALDPQDGRGERFWLMSVEWSSSAAGEHYTLWPKSRKGKARIMPVPLMENGKPTFPNSRIVGVLVSTIFYNSRVQPEQLEPTQF